MDKCQKYHRLGVMVQGAARSSFAPITLKCVSQMIDFVGISAGSIDKYNIYLFIVGLLGLPSDNFNLYRSLGCSVAQVEFSEPQSKVQLVGIIYRKADNHSEFPLTKALHFSEMVYGIIGKA